MAEKILKMSEAKKPVTRISKSVAIDADGNKVRTDKSVKNPGGEAVRPKAFKSAEDFLNAFIDFIDYVESTDYEIVPTKTDFAKWLGINRRTVYKAITDYYPESKKEYTDALSDCLSRGAMLGKYDKTMTIFCLKNWCDWADKREDKVEHSKTKVASKAEAQQAIREYNESRKQA